jgi:hypothetical protein
MYASHGITVMDVDAKFSALSISRVLEKYHVFLKYFGFRVPSSV